MTTSLRLADAREMTPPVAALGERAQAARAAIAGSVSDDDLAAIMAAQVKKAKAGDSAAAKFVLDQIVGKSPSIQVNMGVRDRRPMDGGEPSVGGRAVLMSPMAEPKEVTVGESRRQIARYLAKNGPQSWADLAELFLIDEECEDTVMIHGWFEKCLPDGWQVTATGKREAKASG